ncbi:MAG: diacylglycerol kinase catalytic region [Micavibrio sp.]|nr:diacylglycerol kinase catalytic region [Micavibrio sp.]
MRYHVLINARSGTTLKVGQEEIEKTLRENLEIETLDFLEGEVLFSRMKELTETPYPILIGGGDGSMAKAAQIHLAVNKPFGILPFGTMNLLARDLDIPVDFQESVKAYKETQIISIDVAKANDEVFLCCAAFGSMPEAARVREKNRHLPDIIMLPRVTAYVYNRLDFHRKRHIRLTLDNTFKKIRTGMLIVSNNCYVPGERGAFYKETLQEGVLGVYTVTPKTLWDKIRLAISLRTGAWRSDPSVSEAHANTVVINTNRKTELISLDGEPLEMKMPLRCHVMKQALQVIVPVPVAAEVTEAA